jgi:hypothetical protein
VRRVGGVAGWHDSGAERVGREPFAIDRRTDGAADDRSAHAHHHAGRDYERDSRGHPRPNSEADPDPDTRAHASADAEADRPTHCGAHAQADQAHVDAQAHSEAHVSPGRGRRRAEGGGLRVRAG